MITFVVWKVYKIISFDIYVTIKMSKQLIQQSMSTRHEGLGCAGWVSRSSALSQLLPASQRLLGLGPSLCPTMHLNDPDTRTLMTSIQEAHCCLTVCSVLGSAHHTK